MTNEATTSEAKVLEATETAVSRSTEILTQAFFRDFPRDAARKLESLMPEDAAHILASQPPMLRQRVWVNITPPAASQILPLTPDAVALELLTALDAGPCASPSP